MITKETSVPVLPILTLGEQEARSALASRYIERSNDALVGYCTTLDCLSWEASGRKWASHLEEVADGGLERLDQLHDLIDGLATAMVDPTQNPGRIEALMIRALRSMGRVERRAMRLAYHCDPALPSIVNERAMGAYC